MQDPPYHPRGFILAVLSVLLAIALMVGTVGYQRRPAPLCFGQLGAGFPLPFLCDDAGGSPLSSAGKIDSADLSNISLGVFLDIPFYSVLLWVAGYGVLWVARRLRRLIKT